jgi:hypothetical protein
LFSSHQDKQKNIYELSSSEFHEENTISKGLIQENMPSRFLQIEEWIALYMLEMLQGDRLARTFNEIYLKKYFSSV